MLPDGIEGTDVSNDLMAKSCGGFERVIAPSLRTALTKRQLLLVTED